MTNSLLVTGGAGFIGGNFVNRMVGGHGAEVVTLDKLTYAGRRETLSALDGNPRHRFVHGDIADRALVAGLLAEHRPRALINFAAETHVDRSIDSARPFLDTNVFGLFELLEAVRDYLAEATAAARAAFRLVHVSTDEVFGDLASTEAAPFTEATAYAPSSPYAASKAAADHLVRAWGRTYGVPAMVTNCSNNYGPYQYPEKLIPLSIVNALEGAPLPIYGDGGQIRDWLYVEDHCAALARALDAGRPAATYLIGGRAERTNLQVVRALCAVLDRLCPDSPHRPHADLIAFVGDRPGHDRRYAIDPSATESALGWRAEETFDTGLEKTVRWYLDNEWWWRPIRDRAYSGQRLGRGA